MYYYKVCMVIWHPISLKNSFLIFYLSFQWQIILNRRTPASWVWKSWNQLNALTVMKGFPTLSRMHPQFTKCFYFYFYWIFIDKNAHKSVTPTLQVKTLQDQLATPLHSSRASQLVTCGFGDLTIGKPNKMIYWILSNEDTQFNNSYIVGLSITRSLWCTPLLIQGFPLVQCFFRFCKVACGATSALHVLFNWLTFRVVGNCFEPHSQIIYL